MISIIFIIINHSYFIYLLLYKPPYPFSPQSAVAYKQRMDYERDLIEFIELNFVFIDDDVLEDIELEDDVTVCSLPLFNTLLGLFVATIVSKGLFALYLDDTECGESP